MDWQQTNNKIDYEPYYYQILGEKTGEHAVDNQLASFGNDDAVRIKIFKETHDDSWLNRHFKAEQKLITNETSSTAIDLDGVMQTNQQTTDKRVRRANSIETLTQSQAGQYGLSKNVLYYDNTATGCDDGENGLLTPKNFSQHPYHTSEISMLQADGMRYVYGLPTYNNKQVDNLFAIDQNHGNYINMANQSDALIHTGGSDNYGGINVTGTDNQFVSKNELPAYATSWLLTSILSTDYLDVTGNGPSQDDFGYWVKFNYKKVYNSYNWRAPYADANFNDGFKNYDKDNKASYTYGEKEIYILESIETKTHIAVFETSCRKDSYEAKNEYEGGLGTKTLQKLDRIKLYTIKEHNKPLGTRVPTKVINFEYSYDLCPNVPNNKTGAGTSEVVIRPDDNGNMVSVDLNQRHGKLTLNRIYFTYQTSTRGAASPYVFKYGDLNSSQDNPAYDKLSMDRWGNYKNPLQYASPGAAAIGYPYLDHPYTDQEKDYYEYTAGVNTTTSFLKPAQWTLKEVQLPTGGNLKIEYEFDDYAYVENKQATRMFDICGLGNSAGPVSLTGANGRFNSDAFQDLENSANDSYDRIYFKLEKPMSVLRSELHIPTGMTDEAVFKQLYLDNLPGGYVYFSILSKLTNKGDHSDEDYVKGYAKVDPNNYGLYTSSLVEYGYVGLQRDPLATPNLLGKTVSPFIRRSLEHLRANRQELTTNFIQNTDNSAATQVLALFNALPGQLNDLMSSTVGFNNYGFLLNWSKKIKLNGFSGIRLCEPDYKKIGGGVRVKKITLDDKWKNDLSGSSPENSLYGQKFCYTTTTTIGDNEVTISSGVAYEPQIGSEESALRMPVPYQNSIPLHGAYNLFLETPIMDDYYPGPSVGYSKVTVESIAPERAEAEDPTPGAMGITLNKLKYSAAPITINEFYTPKDFPVVFSKTDMNPGQPIRIPLMVPGVINSFTTRQAKSQGYSIILNDMAGKPKAVTIKTRNGDQVISRQKFIYNTEKEYNENAVNKLSSKVQTLEIDKNTFDVKYITSIVGQSHDMFIDMNEDNQKMETFGLEMNVDFYYTPPTLFAFMVMPIPHIDATESSLRTVVFNKVINRSGIMKKVETTTNESTLITENLAFDIQTGEPLLTKVTNEFKDPVYNFTYPAHWYYPGMSGAYQNTGLKIDPPGGTYISSGVNGYIDFDLTTPSYDILNSRKVSDYFTKGDYVSVLSGSTMSSAVTKCYHVFNIDDANNSMILIDAAGMLFTPSTRVYTIKVIRSGFRNMLSAKAGGLTFKDLWGPAPGNTFHDYIPWQDLSTVVNTLNTVDFTNADHNKIVNASAVQYSDSWQVFAGPKQPVKDVRYCDISDVGNSMVNFLNTINEAGKLFNTTTTIYDEATDLYSYGFTSEMLASNGSIAAGIASAGNQTLTYAGSGIVGGNIGLHFSAGVVGDSARGCTMYLDPATTWSGSIISFNQMNYDPSTGGVTITATTDDGNTVVFTVACRPETFVPGVCCWDFVSCITETIPDYGCGITTCEPVNPYWAGMKGIWRVQSSYVYNTVRTQTDNVREDGLYTDYARFPWEDPSLKSAKWINASTVTKYSPFGFELENKDALGNYSSAVYGYRNSMLIALGANSRYNEIAFDNFEDYPDQCANSHFKFNDFGSNLTTAQAHTGKWSIQVNSNSSVYQDVETDPGVAFTPINDHTNPTVPATVPSYCPEPPVSHDYVHYVSKGDLLGIFAPVASKKYVASVWVKEAPSASVSYSGITAYTKAKLKITVSNGSGVMVTYTFSPKGNVIDGWQQVFESFDIPAGATDVDVELVNTSTTGALAYFDDIRIHPFDGNMVSYVYDAISLKTLAELDANNYATIYVYDDEGHLNKVKKETAQGIKTIKEGRINTKKIYE